MSYRIESATGPKLAEHRPRILELFRTCFGKELSASFWDWAYQLNPCGDAFVNLAYHGDSLVGHYAAIPQYYASGTDRVKWLLSMTTMVHPEHRSAGLFRDLASKTYEKAAQDQISGVLGFPNHNSAPGFRKRLEWIIQDEWALRRLDLSAMKIKSVDASELSISEFSAQYKPAPISISLDLTRKDLLSWRISKPKASYRLTRINDDVFILKSYGETLDVIYGEDSLEAAAQYAAREGFKYLCVYSPTDPSFAPVIERSPYPFGWRVFGEQPANFSPNLLMSDVL